MPENPAILTKQPGGWTLIVLLIVVAIIALLMMYYLPSILYIPPSSPDEEGTRKPITEHVKDQLAPIDQRNKQLEDFLPKKGQPEDDQALE